MKKLLILTVLSMLMACAPQEGKYTKIDNLSAFLYEECINKVVYYRSAHHLAPAFKPDNTVYTCEK